MTRPRRLMRFPLSRERIGWLPVTALVVLAASAAGSSGCAKKVVAAPVPPPPLAVPVVPPRLVGPVLVEEEAPAPVAEAPEPAPVRPTSRPARTRATTEPRPDAAPAEAGRSEPTEAGANASAATPTEPLLRTPETANDTEASRRVRDTIGRAQKNLDKVDYRTLSTNGRAQADTARRFIAQADAALKNRQLTFARYLADKAETLSTSLLNR